MRTIFSCVLGNVTIATVMGECLSPYHRGGVTLLADEGSKRLTIVLQLRIRINIRMVNGCMYMVNPLFVINNRQPI